MAQSLSQAATGVRERTPWEKFRAQLSTPDMRKQIANLIGSANVDRFVQVACNAVAANPKLLAADGRSLLLSVLKAATDRLMPDNREATFTIFNTKEKIDGREVWVDKVQYMPMVGGIIKKIYGVDGVKMVDAVAVFDADRFAYERGDNPKIEHVPYDGDEDPGEVRAAYVIIKFANGEVKREVMFRRDIEKAHQVSQSFKMAKRYDKEETGPWADWYDQMAIKTVLHRVCKQLDTTPELDATIEADDVALGFKGAAEPSLLAEHAGGEPVPTAAQGVPAQEKERVHTDQQSTVPQGKVQAAPQKEAEAPRTEPPPVQSNGGAEGPPPWDEPPHTADLMQAEAGQRTEPSPVNYGEKSLFTKLSERMVKSTDKDILDAVMDEARGLSFDNKLTTAELKSIETLYANELPRVMPKAARTKRNAAG